MNDLQISKVLSKYINLKNALSVGLTFTLTAFLNSLEADIQDLSKYMIVLTFLFILWALVYIVERGGISIVSWLAKFYENKQTHKQEVTLAQLDFASMMGHPLKRVEPIQHPVINGSIPEMEITNQEGYQRPGE